MPFVNIKNSLCEKKYKKNGRDAIDRHMAILIYVDLPENRLADRSMVRLEFFLSNCEHRKTKSLPLINRPKIIP